MNEAYLTDDVSLRKNDFFIHLARELRVYWVVCAEFRNDRKSKINVQNGGLPAKWCSLAAYTYLKNLDTSRALTDESLWRDQLPGVVGLNAAEFPRAKEDRLTYMRSVVTDANELNADVVFWDLSTGVATKAMNDAAESKRTADPCYIYWDELRQVVESTNGITCFYQHGRRATWDSIYQEYEFALGRSIRSRDEQPLVRTIARAKLVFIAPARQTGKLNELSESVAGYTGSNQPIAIVGTATMDSQ